MEDRPGRAHGFGVFLALLCLSFLVATTARGAQAPPPAPPGANADDPTNPFSDLFKFDPKAPHQILGLPTADPPVPHLSLKASVEPASARPGTVVHLTIEGRLDPGFHTYPLTQQTPRGPLSRLDYAESPDFQPIWKPLTETEPEFEEEPDNSILLVYKGDFTWSQDVLIKPDAKPGPKTLKLKVAGQVCDNNSCRPFRHPLEVQVVVASGQPAPISDDLRQRLKATEPDVSIKEPPGEAAALDRSDGSFMALILTTMGFAGLMLLTPCVFPMIPITVSFFLKQGEKEHHNALLTAAVYSLTIVIVLAAGMLLLGGLIIQLASNAWLNLGLGAILIFFALSLFGMYEIELPSGLARFTAGHESKGGYIGAFFMALTFTITSFTCTGPFLGPILAGAKELQLTMGRLILASLVYSATFAAPFFVLALFPRLLKTLPRSGAWLNAVKVVMGFLEIAAALKFLGNTDLALNPGNARLFNYETVLCAWVALSVACGLYLLGFYRLPHDTPLDHVGVLRMLLGTIFLGLAVYMAPALWRVTPQGAIGEGLVAFLPWDSKPAQQDSRTGQPEQEWSRDFTMAWKQATDSDKDIFIDFTGVTCTNCRANEKNVFVLPAVRKEFEKYILVKLYTDSVPDRNLTRAEAVAQAERNSDLQAATFGDVSNPLYAIIKPRKGEQPFVTESDGKSRINGANRKWIRKGLIPSDKVQDFENFLRNPQTGSGLETLARGPSVLGSP
jgi:thiol:disulfide interchange protein DsbD